MRELVRLLIKKLKTNLFTSKHFFSIYERGMGKTEFIKHNIRLDHSFPK